RAQPLQPRDLSHCEPDFNGCRCNPVTPLGSPSVSAAVRTRSAGARVFPVSSASPVSLPGIHGNAAQEDTAVWAICSFQYKVQLTQNPDSVRLAVAHIQNAVGEQHRV